ncbi:3-oxoacyl-[acyl-carrier protein] reductase [Caldibacillus thermoamylovorans]|jgi:3-oxoacyl-[acyl-carrier protein] reductase|uniref:3-oxoacyl-[acyl-carrier protein] reductase n=1 Tax=Caldibacillus thermoamylovorans TaxID=35841 RepID=A0A0D0EMX7_9BACI|nr:MULTISPECIES: 3-oxoacyl-ACP reductase family protein [Bacillaceae]MCB5934260.1 3-oxoacyl-ACP reductase FabG [Bacillus sp. DFI.2.34]AWI12346.1 3-oxoacyl-ACP reductase FabG [Caldibacillus thermoamylovorans]KIO58785.1 3-oxoacyl-[acyl-carrier protein] reductase [Caldibacillus thermoamylovorans]KIO67843.1 3-oxoacyl-[acyl-carrier protein] reductase [Caldibacillus thermoamylovorans]KIO71068.1 3-oxoacyl-[acyl-carrier protein] reductase [Caldibacillus thermoamylovorans]
MSSWDEFLKGKTAIITGASRGIGRATALALAEAGADIVITDILLESDDSNEQVAEKYGPIAQIMQSTNVIYSEKTTMEIREMGRKAMAIKMDVTDREQIKNVFAHVKEEFGKIDILVNNAGTLDHVSQITDQNDDFWQRDLNVNLTGTYNCTKAVWPYMKEQQYGKIINLSSVAGTLGGFGQASYSATKGGILSFTKSMALEGARHGINVNAIVPGVIESEAFRMGNPNMNERMIKRTAFRRPGQPEDIANAITFLVSDKAKYITGIGLNVSGGIELFTF